MWVIPVAQSQLSWRRSLEWWIVGFQIFANCRIFGSPCSAVVMSKHPIQGSPSPAGQTMALQTLQNEKTFTVHRTIVIWKFLLLRWKSVILTSRKPRTWLCLAQSIILGSCQPCQCYPEHQTVKQIVLMSRTDSCCTTGGWWLRHLHQFHVLTKLRLWHEVTFFNARLERPIDLWHATRYRTQNVVSTSIDGYCDLVTTSWLRHFHDVLMTSADPTWSGSLVRNAHVKLYRTWKWSPTFEHRPLWKAYLLPIFHHYWSFARFPRPWKSALETCNTHAKGSCQQCGTNKPPRKPAVPRETSMELFYWHLQIAILLENDTENTKNAPFSNGDCQACSVRNVPCEVAYNLTNAWRTVLHHLEHLPIRASSSISLLKSTIQQKISPPVAKACHSTMSRAEY